MKENTKKHCEKGTLCEINPGECAKIAAIDLSGNIRRRLQDLGLIEGTSVTVLNKSPSGNPVAYLVRGTAIAIRNEDSRHIFIK